MIDDRGYSDSESFRALDEDDNNIGE